MQEFFILKKIIFYRKILRINKMEVIKMKILNTEIAHINESKLGFEHWVDVTYQAPILTNTYTVRVMLLLAFKTEDPEVIDYIVREWKRRDIIHHSFLMYEQEKRGKKGA